MKIAVLCPRFPYPLEKGDKLRMYHQLNGLAHHHDICLIALTSDEPQQSDLEMIRPWVTEMHVLRLPRWRRSLSVVKAMFGKMPLSVAYHYTSHIHKEIECIIQDFEPEHLYYQLTRMCEYRVDKNIPATLDYMDAFGIGMSRRGKATRGLIKYMYALESKRMIAYERKVYDLHDHCTIISDQDRKEIAVNDRSAIIVNPNGVDTGYYAPRAEVEDKYDIGFVGNMGYVPNIDAVHYLISEVLPKLNADTRVLIAGARPTEAVKKLASDRVEVSGWVEDIRDAYASCKVFVAPLWVGTGQQNKILEAMAMGVPCITTPEVNAAIGASDGKHVIVARETSEFQSAIEYLLFDTDARKKMANEARQFVVRNFGWERNIEVLNNIFEV